MPAKYEVAPKRLTIAAARRAVKKVKQENAAKKTVVKKTAKKATAKKPVTAKVMKPAIKAKWLDALNSGKYPKTVGVLKDDVGYCCLGVLCDLYAKTRRNGSKFIPMELAGMGDNDEKFAINEMEVAESYLPSTVAKWAGIPTADVSDIFATDDIQRQLASLNDTSDDFSEVIKYISKTL